MAPKLMTVDDFLLYATQLLDGDEARTERDRLRPKRFGKLIEPVLMVETDISEDSSVEHRPRAVELILEDLAPDANWRTYRQLLDLYENDERTERGYYGSTNYRQSFIRLRPLYTALVDASILLDPGENQLVQEWRDETRTTVTRLHDILKAYEERGGFQHVECHVVDRAASRREAELLGVARITGITFGPYGARGVIRSLSACETIGEHAGETSWRRLTMTESGFSDNVVSEVGLPSLGNVILTRDLYLGLLDMHLLQLPELVHIDDVPRPGGMRA